MLDSVKECICSTKRVKGSHEITTACIHQARPCPRVGGMSLSCTKGLRTGCVRKMFFTLCFKVNQQGFCGT